MPWPASHHSARCQPVPLPLVVTGAISTGHRLRGGVLLLGNHDGLHRGHRSLVALAQRVARGRPVGLMSCEPHPRSFFAREAAPFRIATHASKLELARECGLDFLYSPTFDAAFAGLSPRDFARDILQRALGVSIVIAGPDFRFGCGRSGDLEHLAELGLSHGFSTLRAPEFAPGGQRPSSSLIRRHIRAGELRAAVQLLGAGWLVETVRTAGRLALHPDLCRPRPGRYLARQHGHDYAAPIPVQIMAEGALQPLARHPTHQTAPLWRLIAED